MLLSDCREKVASGQACGIPYWSLRAPAARLDNAELAGRTL